MSRPFSWSEALSPMLVKELRQGMKSRAFVFSFLLLQGLMVFCVLMYLLALEQEQDQRIYNGLFWNCVAIPLVLLVPLRAFQAVHGEIKGNTLELVFLTRLTAWRIVAGKWAALVTQSFLLASAILPYLVLRYFLGSINIADDVLLLGLCLLLSAVLAAVGVALSTFRSQILRGLLVLGGLFLLTGVPMGIMGLLLGGGHSAGPSAYLIVYLLCCAALAILLLLQWGAGRIAPLAENHVTRQRLLAFGMLLLSFVFSRLAHQDELIFLALVVLLPVCVDSLCEPHRPLPLIYAPFVRRGFLGRCLGRLLYPGWPSGLLFSLLALGLLFALAATRHRDLDALTFLFVALLGALIVPLSLLLAFRVTRARLLTFYVSTQIGLFILTMLALALKEAFPGFSLEALALLPTSALLLIVFDQAETYWMPMTATVTGCSLLLLLARMITPFREIRALEQAALGPAAPPPLPSVPRPDEPVA